MLTHPHTHTHAHAHTHTHKLLCVVRAEEYETTHHVIMCLVATYQHLFARAASAVPQLVASSLLTYSVIQLSLSNGASLLSTCL